MRKDRIIEELYKKYIFYFKYISERNKYGKSEDNDSCKNNEIVKIW